MKSFCTPFRSSLSNWGSLLILRSNFEINKLEFTDFFLSTLQNVLGFFFTINKYNLTNHYKSIIFMRK